MPQTKPNNPVFQPGHPRSAGLVAAYLLNERVYGSPAVRNLVPGGIGGASLQTAPTWTSGPYGPCADFPNSAGLASTNLILLGTLGAYTEGTIYVQVSFDTLPAAGNMSLAGCVFNSTGRVYIGTSNTGAMIGRLGGGAQVNSTATPITTGRPFVLCLAFSGTTFDGYVDGVKVISAAAWTNTAGPASGSWGLGGVPTQTAATDGQIHAFLLYNRRHSDTQVQQATGDLQAGAYSWARPRAPLVPLLTATATTTVTAAAGIASTLTIGSPAASLVLSGTAGLASTLTTGSPVGALAIASTAGLASGLVAGSPSGGLAIASTAGLASTLAAGNPAAALALAATAGIASGVVVGNPAGALALAADAGLASTLAAGDPTAAFVIPATVGIAAGLSPGDPSAALALAGDAGLASTLTPGDPVAASGNNAVTGLASTLAIGAPTAALSLAAIAGAGSTLTAGDVAAALALAAQAGLASGLTIGDPTVGSGGTPILADAGLASTLAIGDPAAAFAVTAVAGLASTLVIGGPVYANAPTHADLYRAIQTWWVNQGLRAGVGTLYLNAAPVGRTPPFATVMEQGYDETNWIGSNMVRVSIVAATESDALDRSHLVREAFRHAFPDHAIPEHANGRPFEAIYTGRTFLRIPQPWPGNRPRVVIAQTYRIRNVLPQD